MTLKINYMGAFSTDLGVESERKADGRIPTHAAVIPVSSRRWLAAISTLDSASWDGVRGIVYQLRADAPDGPVLREGLLAAAQNDWDPRGRGEKLLKCHGAPLAFGVPKGAQHDGHPVPHQNVFAVKWYRYAHVPAADGIWNPFAADTRTRHPEFLEIGPRTLRVEWLQCRLNEAENDIEIIRPATMLCQTGYDDSNDFCALGGGYACNNAMAAPVPADADAGIWLEYMTFLPPAGRSGIAAALYRFNPTLGFYEWTATGPFMSIPDRALSESSVMRTPDGWLVAGRDTALDGRTVWWRADDPLAAPVLAGISPADAGPRESPRVVYASADGQLRMFGNEKPFRTPGRNPLCMWEVNPASFQFRNRRVILDARAAGLPFYNPFVDMCKLVPAGQGRQLAIFRCITARQTARMDLTQPVTAAEHAAAGIHYAELHNIE